MFRTTASRLRTWWSATTDDILGGDLTAPEPTLDYFRTHPHRQPLGPALPRRTGGVAPRPAHCRSPVRAPVVAERTGLTRPA
jgi:hypothetical protein